MAKRQPSWMPTQWTEPADKSAVYAIQQVALGNADEEQQIAAMRFIIDKICGTYEVSYDAESQRNTDHAEGKRWVGLQLVGFIKLNHGAFKNE